MKKRSDDTAKDDLPAELPTGALSRGTRGKYHKAYAAGRDTVRMVALEPDVAGEFSNAADVNAALRLVLQIRKVGKPSRRKRSA